MPNNFLSLSYNPYINYFCVLKNTSRIHILAAYRYIIKPRWENITYYCPKTKEKKEKKKEKKQRFDLI